MPKDISELTFVENLEEKKLYFGPLEGFDTMDEVFSFLESQGLKRSSAVIIRYRRKFYGVLMQSYYKEVIIGSDRTWYRDENGYFLVEKTSSFRMPYEITLKVKKSFSKGLVQDLLLIDPNLTAFTSSYGVISENKNLIHGSENNYPVLLGLTMKDSFYSLDEIWRLRSYFHDLMSYRKFIAENKIQLINPFKSLAVKDNRIVHFRVIVTMYGYSFAL